MPKKILLADDSLTIQKVVELTFSEEDYDVTVVGDGAQAIERVTAEPPDIVLADVMMPKKTGYEVCEFVKRGAATRHVPVLLLVGKFEPFDQERATRAGADGHILKPFESNVLVRSVTDLLAAAATAQAKAPPAESAAQTATPAASFPATDAVFESAPPLEESPAGFADPLGSDALASDPMEADAWSPPPAPVARKQSSSTAQLDRPANLGSTPLGTPFTPLPPPVDTLDDPFAQTPSGVFAAQFAEGDSDSDPLTEPLTRPTPAPAIEEPAPRIETRSMSTRPAAPEPAPATVTAAAGHEGAPSEGVSMDDLPEDIVNAIVERVVKRISDDVIREIAWQVVPELAELLIKKKLEELG